MRLRLILSALVLTGLAGRMADAQPPPTAPVGNWLTEDHMGVIRIAPCGMALCGRIVGMLGRPADAGPVLDSKGRPECGLLILRDTGMANSHRWMGIITDPDEGSDWHVELWVDDRDRLHLRGYVLLPLLGETQIWTRYTGTLKSDCSPA